MEHALNEFKSTFIKFQITFAHRKRAIQLYVNQNLSLCKKQSLFITKHTVNEFFSLFHLFISLFKNLVKFWHLLIIDILLSDARLGRMEATEKFAHL